MYEVYMVHLLIDFTNCPGRFQGLRRILNVSSTDPNGGHSKIIGFKVSQ